MEKKIASAELTTNDWKSGGEGRNFFLRSFAVSLKSVIWVIGNRLVMV